MNDTTRLEPLPPAQAQELLEGLRHPRRDDCSALVLDADGQLVGLVGASDEHAEHLETLDA